MKPLSNDLRERILSAVDHHEGSRRPIARRFLVDVSTITRLLQPRRLIGSIALRPHGGGQEPVLDPEALERPRDLVREHPNATLHQLRADLGIGGGLTIVRRALKKLGITRE